MLRLGSAALLALGVFLLALPLTTASVARADSIDYGNFGPQFPPYGTIYRNVTESSATDGVPLYGAPELSGDVLDFDPVGLGAAAVEGHTDVTDGQLNFRIATLEGAGVLSLLIVEGGDLTLFGTGTDATAVVAGASVRVDILDVDGVPLAEPISVYKDASFTLDLASDGPVVLAPWTNDLLVEFGPVLSENEIPFELGVSRAEVVIDNFLLASSELDSTAFIQKKDFRIEPTIEGDPIPEPGVLALLAAGGGLLAIRRRPT